LASRTEYLSVRTIARRIPVRPPRNFLQCAKNRVAIERVSTSREAERTVLDHDLRELVEHCLAGDQAAMVRLVDAYRDRVFGICYRMLGQRQDAEDAAQETFLRVLRSLGRWDQHREFEPWLLAIAANRCRTMLAARTRRSTYHEFHGDQIEDTSPNWQDVDHLKEEVQLALGQLRADYRQAFLLFHEQGLSYEHIAGIMRCPLGTVKTWIYRARQELATRLEQREVVMRTRYEVRRV
jgi:RNA polymerase sigma-70 factor, ECF subfamily